MRSLTRAAAVALTFLALVVYAPAADAGCGCQKPPPAPGQILPHATYAGTPVRIVSASLVTGRSYQVTFRSATGTTSSVLDVADVQRDLADTIAKPMLVVPLPALPLGPAAVTVTDATTGAVVVQIADAELTVAPGPMALPQSYGNWTYAGFQAAVGRDGTAYVSFDLTGLSTPMIFEAQAKGYPLRFTGEDVVFYNVQGFTMQTLVTGDEPVPGMFVFPTSSGSDSDLLHYSRHEFSTYFLQHTERQPHAVDPADPNWHLDGTRHVDHDHLILAIAGTVNGAAPKAGATPTFDLVLGAHSLFHEGVTGISSVSLGSTAVTDSYVPGAWGFGSAGDVFSGGRISVASGAVVNGSLTAASLNVSKSATVTGGKFILTSTPSFMDVKIPSGLTDLGLIDVRGGFRTIQGPGSFTASGITLSGGGMLSIDNSAGPVTIYVTGAVTMDA